MTGYSKPGSMRAERDEWIANVEINLKLIKWDSYCSRDVWDVNFVKESYNYDEFFETTRQLVPTKNVDEDVFMVAPMVVQYRLIHRVRENESQPYKSEIYTFSTIEQMLGKLTLLVVK